MLARAWVFGSRGSDIGDTHGIFAFSATLGGETHDAHARLCLPPPPLVTCSCNLAFPGKHRWNVAMCSMSLLSRGGPLTFLHIVPGVQICPGKNPGKKQVRTREEPGKRQGMTRGKQGQQGTHGQRHGISWEEPGTREEPGKNQGRTREEPGKNQGNQGRTREEPGDPLPGETREEPRENQENQGRTREEPGENQGRTREEPGGPV